jgi:pilus assembly protein CpaB
MNSRTLIMMVVAIAIAIATVIVVKNHSAGDGGLKVLVATGDISAGSFIHADKDVTWVDWPQASLSPSYITPDVHKIEEFNGAVARYPIASGGPITTTSVVRASEGGFMSAVLQPGMRAVSIAVSLTSGNAGFVFPGDKVDLLLTHKIPVKESTGNDSVLASETFIQDVRVLAIDQMLDNPENKAVVAKTITLEVSPKQAEMINVASSLGSISVSLRSLEGNKAVVAAKPGEKEPPAITILPQNAVSNYSTDNDVSKLMGDKSTVRAKVSVYHGGTSEQIDFHQGGK